MRAEDVTRLVGGPPAAPAAGAGQRLRDELAALEERARRARKADGEPASRKAAVREVRRRTGAILHDQRIASWLHPDPARRRVPGDSDRVWDLIEIWSEWARVRPNRQRWNDLVEAAHDERRPVATAAAPPGRPLSRVADPFALGVHQAVEVSGHGGLPELPPYLPREHDRRLGEVARRAAGGRSGLAVLVGESSVGKTRACWECLRALPASWRLWAPESAEALLAELDAVAPRTVVWLNESQRFLLKSDHVAGRLRELLHDPDRAPVLVLGTLWPQHWDTLTTPPPQPEAEDPYERSRRLLIGGAIRVRPAFSTAELSAVRAAADAGPQLRQALDGAERGRITQYLAGVPVLMERYDNAPAAARALIHAAMDARRLGAGVALPLGLLRDAAPGYLTDQEWNEAGDDWLERALVYTSAPCRGVAGPLTLNRPRPDEPAGTPSCRLADYLEQHGRQSRRFAVPPEAFWRAAARHVTSADDLHALATAALERLRYRQAALIAGRAASAGRFDALYRVALELETGGNRDGAERLYRIGAEAGDPSGFYGLAMLREEEGDQAEAQRIVLAAGDELVEWYVEAHWRFGNTAHAERFAVRAYGLGHRRGLWAVAARIPIGDREGQRRLYQVAADAGETDALALLAAVTDDPAEAERLYRAAADAGVVAAMWEMAWRSDAECEHYVTQALAAGDYLIPPHAHAESLVIRREQAGDRQGAERLNAVLAAAGLSALDRIAELRMDAGDDAAVMPLAPELAAGGFTGPLGRLALRRADAGDAPGAERVALLARDAGDVRPLRTLARRAGSGREAERLCLLAGDHAGLRAIARWHERRGDPGEAARVHQAGADAGDLLALQALARLREAAGHPDEAERLAARAAAMGDPRALRTLAWMRERRGDGRAAERLAAEAAARGSTAALRSLAVLRERAGDHAAAESLAHRAARHGDGHALAVLARLRRRAGAREQAVRLAESAAAAKPAAPTPRRAVAEPAPRRKVALPPRDPFADEVNSLLDLAWRSPEAEAEELIRRAADAGHGHPLLRLAAEQGWDLLPRYGLDADGRTAEPW
ncbi:hypothetical protein ACBI99_32660 [Nonomuraea sp. ATR24]|uniref:hypothetical protein n=1 Tax=Nonomuraea sp. ATR24 TaxID=1676744 RepID=UPI0035BF188A